MARRSMASMGASECVAQQTLDEYSGPGMHWIISTTAVGGRISIKDGL